MVTVKGGARIAGIEGFEEFAWGLAGGDFNGDGIDDIAATYILRGINRAQSFAYVKVMYGGDGVFEGDVAAGDLTSGTVGTTGTIDIGIGVSLPGPLEFADVNGDGRDDLLIGAPRAESGIPGTNGAAYILFGQDTDPTFSFGISQLTNGTDGQGFQFLTGRNTGSAFTSLGDVDGDGENELLITSPFATSPAGDALSGIGFVLERPTAASTDLIGALADPQTVAATLIVGGERTLLGEEASAVGDVNGDGFADFVLAGTGAIGAADETFQLTSGEAYVIYGSATALPEQIDVRELDGTNGTKIIGSNSFILQNQIDEAGDVNGDGFADFIVYDEGANDDVANFYLVYGREGGLGETFDVSTEPGTSVTDIGFSNGSSSSWAPDTAALGDVNGDGYDDILVTRLFSGAQGAGEVILIFGAEGSLGETVDVDDLAPGAGYRFTATELDYGAGLALSGPGDVNGDGVNDLVIGVPFYATGFNGEGFDFTPGAAYVVLGGAERLAALDALSGTDGLIELADIPKDIEIDEGTPTTSYSMGEDFAVTEVNGGDVTFTITVNRDDTTGQAAFDLTLSGDATIASGDLTFVGGSQVFSDGQSSATLTYRATDDALVEGSEQAIFDLAITSSEQTATVSDARQIVTIGDDDLPPAVFSLGADVSVDETTNGGSTDFAITITRSETAGAAEVALAYSGSAAFGADFSRIGGDTVFADGENQTTVLYRTSADGNGEGDEQAIFDLSLVSSDAPASLGDAQQVVTLAEVEDSVSEFELGSDLVVSEDNGAVVRFIITVTRTNSDGPADFALSFGGSADPIGSGRDFRLIAGTTDFADGQTSQQLTYELTDDRRFEGTETIIATLNVLSSVSPAVVVGGTQIITIQDDDNPAPITGTPQRDTLNGGIGNDTITALASNDLVRSGAGNDTVFGGAGNDFLYGGSGADRLSGQTGFDYIDAGSGVDLVYGGSGNDSIIGGADRDFLYGGSGNDAIDGGSGNDNVSGSGGKDTLRGGTGNDKIYGGDGVDRLDGESGNDILYGGSSRDGAFGGSGNDAIFGGDGNDVAFGGRGNDTVEGGDGNDDLFGGSSGNDILRGDAGNDCLEGRNGNDTLFGGIGNDKIYGGAGLDTIFGGAGRDTLYGDEGRDRIYSGTGLDSVFGGDGNDILFGNTGTQRLYGDNGNDLFYGLAGNDTLFGGLGEDVLNGGSGNDVLSGQSFRDTLNGGDGNDVLYGGSSQDSLYGDDGRDTLYGGTSADELFGGSSIDSLYGGDGHDTLYGGRSSDAIAGDDGNDALFGGSSLDVLRGGIGEDDLFGGHGNDRLFGGADNDTIRGGDGNDLLAGGDGRDRLLGNEGDDTLSGGSGLDFLWGEAGNDTLTGGATRDILYGGDGVDKLYGGTGGDALAGGDFVDSLYGGTGNDRLFGGSGSDRMFGEDGDDELKGGTFADIMYGGDGDDSFEGESGRDRIFGGAGGDRARGGTGNDTISGQSGFDRLAGEFGDDTLYGGDNRDFLFGGSGNDLLSGGNAGDWMRGGTGSDSLIGDDGSDVLFGDEGRDRIKGGDGNDEINGGDDGDVLFGEAGNDTINGEDGYDLMTGNAGFDRLFGSAGADRMYGGQNSDRLYGGSDDDRLFGGSAQDLLYGGAGDDLVVGGAGFDQVFGFSGDDKVFGGAANDRVFGSSGDDRVYGGSGNDLVDGGAGDDYLNGDSGDDSLYGGDGNDLLSDSSGSDFFSAGAGNDYVYGGAGKDGVNGGVGNDVLFGGIGDDFVRGQRGNDTIFGGDGDDTLIGDSGRDVFVFDTDDGDNVIRDFTPGVDKLDVGGFRFTELPFDPSMSDLTYVLGETRITLKDLQIGDLSSSDFI